MKYLLFLAAFLASTLFAQAAKPNIIFILTDDQRYDAMGFMGRYPFLKTPNIDRIRNEGVHFKNCFVTLSLCAPSRAGFLTGTYPQVNGVTTNVEGREYNPDKTPSFPQVLQKNGYRTAFLGKWHMDHSNKPRRGFDHWISFSGQGRYNGNTLNVNGKEIKNPGYISDELTKYAVDFIEKNSDKPFCLYLSHKAVHQPFTPAKRHKHLYADAPVPKCINFFDTLKGKPAWQRARRKPEQMNRLRYNNTYTPPAELPYNGQYNEKLGGIPKTKDYLRGILAVDEGIGKLYKALEKKGILENTVIIFAGDNGYFLGEHRRGDKRAHYNESMRIPMVMRLPGKVPAKSTLSQMILNIDVAPTILELAGAKAPAIMQGRSIMPLFEKEKNMEWRNSFLFTYWRDLTPTIPRIVAIRTERYVYCTYPDIDDLDELYDLQKDPYEMANLAASPKHAQLINEMQTKLEKLKKETKYRKIVPRPRPEPKWGVNNGLICDLDFSKAKTLKVQDSSPVKNHPKVKGGALVKGLTGQAFSFDGGARISLSWHEQVTPEKGGFVIETLVRPSADGVIAAQGNAHTGLMIYVDGGCPGVMVKAGTIRTQFLDAQRSFNGQWVHVVAQVKNYHNKLLLWVNGTLVAEQQIMWPFRKMHKGIGGMTLGADPKGKIDPKEVSPLTFKGDVQYFRIHREADVSDILNNAKELGLSYDSGKPRIQKKPQ